MTNGPRSVIALVALMAVLTACTGFGAGLHASGSSVAVSSGPEPSASTSSSAQSSSAQSSSAEPSIAERSGTPAELAAILGPDVTQRKDGEFGSDRWTLVDAGARVDGGTALRVHYPRGSASPEASRVYGSPGGGMQMFLPATGRSLDDAYLRYWVRFPTDFEFVRGGKLPGLFGGTEVSGGEQPDGTNGFSTRLMWRSLGAGEVYLYAPHESGASLGRGSWTWPRGAWTCVEQHVTLNRPGSNDGSVTVWLNGTQVLSRQGILYRTVDSLKIDGIFFSTFYGGADPGWAPSRDEHVDFAGFALSPQRVGCSRG